METKDISKLRLGSTIWWEHRELVIDTLTGSVNHPRISFHGDSSTYDWSVICISCSLEEPKKKKKYWQWKINHDGRWYRDDHYLDNDGIDSKGIKRYDKEVDWKQAEKIKIEDDYINV